MNDFQKSTRDFIQSVLKIHAEQVEIAKEIHKNRGNPYHDIEEEINCLCKQNSEVICKHFSDTLLNEMRRELKVEA